MLEERGWMRFNSLIQVTKKSTGLELFTNVVYHFHIDYKYYMPCKHIDYRPYVINDLIHLQPPNRHSIQNRRSIRMTKKMCEIMKNNFCQLGAEWVIVRGLHLKLYTRHMYPIPKHMTIFYCSNSIICIQPIWIYCENLYGSDGSNES